MNEKQITAITIRNDLHADVVFQKIRKAGARAFRLNLDEFPQHYDLSIRHAGDRWRGEIYNRISGDALPLDDAGAFWVRKKGNFSYNAALSAQERAFADSEMEHLLFGLYNFRDGYWMSHPSNVRKAIWKLDQLQRAGRFGFVTSRSIVASSPETVREFKDASKHGVVFKTLSGSSLAAEAVSDDEVETYGLKTTLIDNENEDMLDSVGSATVILLETVTVFLLLPGGSLAAVGGAVAGILVFCFTIGIATVIFQNRLIRCNCFGASAHPITPLDIVRNIIILSVCGVFLIASQNQPAHLAAPWPLLSGGVLFCTAMTFSIFTMNMNNLRFLMRRASLD